MVEDIGGTIIYSVKELLAEIRAKLEFIDGKLDSKADRADVTALVTRIDRLDERLDSVERETEHMSRLKQETTEWRRYVIPAAMTMALIILGVLQLVH